MRRHQHNSQIVRPSPRRRLVGIAACSTALVITGCSSDDASNTGTTTAPTTTSTSMPAPSGGSTASGGSSPAGSDTTPVQSGPIDPGMVLSSDDVVTSLDVEPAATTKP